MFHSGTLYKTYIAPLKSLAYETTQKHTRVLHKEVVLEINFNVI